MRYLLVLLQIIFVMTPLDARETTEVSDDCKKLSKILADTKLEFSFNHYDGYLVETLAYVHFVEPSCLISATSNHFEFKKEGGTPFSFHMSSDLHADYKINSPCESSIYQGITNRFINADVDLTQENRDDIHNASKSYCKAFESKMIEALNSALGFK